MIQKAALCACSNLLSKEQQIHIEKLKRILSSFNIETVESPCLYADGRLEIGLGKRKAAILNQFYADPSIDAIFDVSGGDLANEVLSYLDYDLIQQSDKIFCGYSDVTTVINAIYTKTGKASVLYQIRNLVLNTDGTQIERFRRFLLEEGQLTEPKWQVLQGAGTVEEMIKNHTIIGGNARCFLKLAGTDYCPDLKGKILFLESMGGGIPQISTYFASLKQLGFFDQAEGILLGTFTQLEREYGIECVYTILKQYISEEMFAAKTQEIGHGHDSKALIIGGSEPKKH